MNLGTATAMFEVLDTTEEDLVAVRVGAGSKSGYEEFYSLLAERTREYGSIRVYEEVPNWSFGTYLSHFHGILPDLRYGNRFDISRYACAGDSLWAKLLYFQWKGIRPVWPVAPDTMRYFPLHRREAALRWLTEVRDR